MAGTGGQTSLRRNSSEAPFIRQPLPVRGAASLLGAYLLCIRPAAMAITRQLWVIFGFVFVDILGYSLILPLIPYYAAEYKATPTETGWLLSANAIAQLLAAPIIGKLSDKYGRRPLLLLCIAGTLGSFVLLSVARSLTIILISRVLDGLLGGDVTLAQAYMTDISKPEERSKVMGLIGAAYGVSFIFGPALGGILAQVDPSLPAYLAAILSFCNLLGIYWWLPESLPPRLRDKNPWWRYFPLITLIEVLRIPGVAILLLQRLCYMLAFTLFETGHAHHMSARFQMGYVLTFFAAFYAAVQGGMAARLTKRFGQHAPAFCAIVMLAASLWAYSTVTSLFGLLLATTFLAVSSGLVQTLISTAISQLVQHDEVGGAMGISAAIGSFSRVVAPPVGGAFTERFGAGQHAALAAVMVALAALLSPLTHKGNGSPVKKEKEKGKTKSPKRLAPNSPKLPRSPKNANKGVGKRSPRK